MNYAVFVSAIILSVFFDFNPVQSGAGAAAAEPIQPLITTSELVVGMNRFAFGLLKDHKLLEGANVTLRLCHGRIGSDLNGRTQCPLPGHK